MPPGKSKKAYNFQRAQQEFLTKWLINAFAWFQVLVKCLSTVFNCNFFFFTATIWHHNMMQIEFTRICPCYPFTSKTSSWRFFFFADKQISPSEIDGFLSFMMQLQTSSSRWTCWDLDFSAPGHHFSLWCYSYRALFFLYLSMRQFKVETRINWLLQLFVIIATNHIFMLLNVELS